MPAGLPAVSDVNAMPRDAFVAAFGSVFEHSPWVAERAWARRPFDSVDGLHAAMAAVVRASAPDEQLALLRAHPELAGREAQAGVLTAESTGEQGRLGFTALSRAEFERVARANAAYRERHGFPCIVALRLHATRDTVIAEMERRAASDDTDAERRAALEQIEAITRGRLDRLIAP
jgi:2-oxo-4-hydroxy-4-carboxy-5-ureidoimidazoline decarboxylase